MSGPRDEVISIALDDVSTGHSIHRDADSAQPKPRAVTPRPIINRAIGADSRKSTSDQKSMKSRSSLIFFIGIGFFSVSLMGRVVVASTGIVDLKLSIDPPETMHTGQLSPFSAIHARLSNPSISGIIKSKTTREGSLILSKVPVRSRPFSHSITCQPSPSATWRMNSLNSGSSSVIIRVFFEDDSTTFPDVFATKDPNFLDDRRALRTG